MFSFLTSELAHAKFQQSDLVFVLRNRMMFPIQLDVDEGIRSELHLPTDIKIQSNADLNEIVTDIFASHKLGTIVMQMMAENKK